MAQRRGFLGYFCKLSYSIRNLCQRKVLNPSPELQFSALTLFHLCFLTLFISSQRYNFILLPQSFYPGMKLYLYVLHFISSYSAEKGKIDHTSAYYEAIRNQQYIYGVLFSCQCIKVAQVITGIGCSLVHNFVLTSPQFARCLLSVPSSLLI